MDFQILIPAFIVNYIPGVIKLQIKSVTNYKVVLDVLIQIPRRRTVYVFAQLSLVLNLGMIQDGK